MRFEGAVLRAAGDLQDFTDSKDHELSGVIALGGWVCPLRTPCPLWWKIFLNHRGHRVHWEKRTGKLVSQQNS
jgi:hypothetical protein